MKINLYHTKMVLNQKPTAQLERQHLAEDSLKNDTANSANNTKPDSAEKITISAAAMKKSQETASAEDKLPAHIKRLKAQIKEIKIQIAAQQQKLAELEQSNLSDDLKEATKELYLDQLMSLQSSLSLTSIALDQAIKDAGITDPTLLMAAIM